MAALLSRTVRSTFVNTAARSCHQYSTRGCQSLSRLEAQLGRVPMAPTAVPASNSSPSVAKLGMSCFRARLTCMAAAQSLLPLHSAFSSARLVSRLSSSSIASPDLIGGKTLQLILFLNHAHGSCCCIDHPATSCA